MLKYPNQLKTKNIAAQSSHLLTAGIPSHGNPFARRFLPPPQPRRPHTALLTSPSLAPPPTPGKGRRKE